MIGNEINHLFIDYPKYKLEENTSFNGKIEIIKDWMVRHEEIIVWTKPPGTHLQDGCRSVKHHHLQDGRSVKHHTLNNSKKSLFNRFDWLLSSDKHIKADYHIESNFTSTSAHIYKSIGVLYI